MLIGELSSITGFSRDTIRFYEKHGILQADERRENNYKEYPPEAIRILRAVARLKGHGYSLRQIREFIGLFTDQNLSCGAAAHLIEGQLYQLKEKIQALEAMHRELRKALHTCQNHPNGKSCRVLTEIFSEKE